MFTKKTNDIKITMITGVFLLSMLLAPIVVTTVFFIFNIPVTAANIIISYIVSATICYFFSDKDIFSALIATVIATAFIAISLYISLNTYDWTWDGNAYHKTMIAFFTNGWNPLRQTFFEFADNNYPLISQWHSAFLDGYPKGTEILGSCFHTLTGNLEASKMFNFISIGAMIFISYPLLTDVLKLKKYQSTICAIFFAVHPISLNQLLSTYNDAFLWNMILLCTIGCIYLTFFEKGKYSALSYYLIFASINIGFNTKFSGIIFFAAVCGTCFLFWVFCKIKSKASNSKTYILRRFSLFAVSVLSGTCFTGCTSYVINLIKYKNPLYSIFGEGSNDIITVFMPDNYLEKSNIERAIHSLFSSANVSKIKIPFTFTAEEINSAQAVDTNFGGWGIFFSGIIIISIIILAFAYIKALKTHPKICRISELLLIAGILCLIVVPGLSWPRYNVAPLFFPVLAIIYIFYQANKKENSSKIFIAGLLVAMLFLNTTPSFGRIKFIYEDTAKSQTIIENLKEISKSKSVSLSTYIPEYDYTMYGRLFDVDELGISNYTYNSNVSTDYTGKIFTYYPIYYKVSEDPSNTNN